MDEQSSLKRKFDETQLNDQVSSPNKKLKPNSVLDAAKAFIKENGQKLLQLGQNYKNLKFPDFCREFKKLLSNSRIKDLIQNLQSALLETDYPELEKNIKIQLYILNLYVDTQKRASNSLPYSSTDAELKQQMNGEKLHAFFKAFAIKFGINETYFHLSYAQPSFHFRVILSFLAVYSDSNVLNLIVKAVLIGMAHAEHQEFCNNISTDKPKITTLMGIFDRTHSNVANDIFNPIHKFLKKIFAFEESNKNFFYSLGKNYCVQLHTKFIQQIQILENNIIAASEEFKTLLDISMPKINNAITDLENIINSKEENEIHPYLPNLEQKKILWARLKTKALSQLNLLISYAEDLNLLENALNNSGRPKYDRELTALFIDELVDSCHFSREDASNLVSSSPDTQILIRKLSFLFMENSLPEDGEHNEIITTVMEGYVERFIKIEENIDINPSPGL